MKDFFTLINKVLFIFKIFKEILNLLLMFSLEMQGRNYIL